MKKGINKIIRMKKVILYIIYCSALSVVRLGTKN